MLEIAGLSSKSPPPVSFTRLGEGIKAQVSGIMSSAGERAERVIEELISIAVVHTKLY